MNETVLMNQIRAVFNSEPSIRLFRNSTGAGRMESGQYVKFGLAVGSADLCGIHKPSGRWVSIEVKMPKGRISPEQIIWQKTIREFGGVSEFVRSVEDALAVVDKIKKGLI